MTCVCCGTPLPVDARECPVCGTSVELADEENLTARWHDWTQVRRTELGQAGGPGGATDPRDASGQPSGEGSPRWQERSGTSGTEPKASGAAGAGGPGSGAAGRPSPGSVPESEEHGPGVPTRPLPGTAATGLVAGTGAGAAGIREPALVPGRASSGQAPPAGGDDPENDEDLLDRLGARSRTVMRRLVAWQPGRVLRVPIAVILLAVLLFGASLGYLMAHHDNANPRADHEPLATLSAPATLPSAVETVGPSGSTAGTTNAGAVTGTPASTGTTADGCPGSGLHNWAADVRVAGDPPSSGQVKNGSAGPTWTLTGLGQGAVLTLHFTAPHQITCVGLVPGRIGPKAGTPAWITRYVVKGINWTFFKSGNSDPQTFLPSQVGRQRLPVHEESVIAVELRVADVQDLGARAGVLDETVLGNIFVAGPN